MGELTLGAGPRPGFESWLQVLAPPGISSWALGKSLFLSSGLDFTFQEMEIVTPVSILVKMETTGMRPLTCDERLPCARHCVERCAWISSMILRKPCEEVLFISSLEHIVAMRNPEGLSRGPRIPELATGRACTQLTRTGNNL